MPFKFPRRTKRRPYIQRTRPEFAKTPEELYGWVNGLSATQGEERFYRAMAKLASVRNIGFRIPVGAPRGMPGWKELDFFVETYTGYRAIQIDGIDYVHRGTSEEDIIRDLITMKYLAPYNIGIVLHVRADQLLTQEDADKVARRIL